MMQLEYLVLQEKHSAATLYSFKSIISLRKTTFYTIFHFSFKCKYYSILSKLVNLIIKDSSYLHLGTL